MTHIEIKQPFEGVGPAITDASGTRLLGVRPGTARQIFHAPLENDPLKAAWQRTGAPYVKALLGTVEQERYDRARVLQTEVAQLRRLRDETEAAYQAHIATQPQRPEDIEPWITHKAALEGRATFYSPMIAQAAAAFDAHIDEIRRDLGFAGMQYRGAIMFQVRELREEAERLESEAGHLEISYGNAVGVVQTWMPDSITITEALRLADDLPPADLPIAQQPAPAVEKPKRSGLFGRSK